MAEKKISFEKALQELEQIVSEMEEGKVPLAESIERYARGTKLVKQCRSILDAAEKKIQLLARGEGDELDSSGELEDAGE